MSASASASAALADGGWTDVGVVEGVDALRGEARRCDAMVMEQSQSSVPSGDWGRRTMTAALRNSLQSRVAGSAAGAGRRAPCALR